MKVTQKNLLSQWPKLTKDQAYSIVRIVNGTVDLEEYKSVQDRIRECYNRPDETHLKLTAVEEILSKVVMTHGIGGVPWDNEYNGYIEYINRGDTYDATIVYNPDQDRFEINNWGSLYEISPACHRESQACEDNECEICN